MRHARVELLACVVLGLALPACRPSEAKESARGRDLFAATCARCHGAEGTGGLPLWDGGPSPRNFRDHAFHASQTDDQLRQTVKNGKPPGMPPFGTTFDDEQLTALVLYVRSLDPERGR